MHLEGEAVVSMVAGEAVALEVCATLILGQILTLILVRSGRGGSQQSYGPPAAVLGIFALSPKVHKN